MHKNNLILLTGNATIYRIMDLFCPASVVGYVLHLSFFEKCMTSAIMYLVTEVDHECRNA